MDSRAAQFVFVTCQVGAEPAVKHDVAREHPGWRFAFSRPGFLTFKLPAGVEVADDFWIRSAFARSFGKVLGTARGDSTDVLAGEVWQIAGPREFGALHVWRREPKKWTGPICRNIPEGASPKLDLSPLSSALSSAPFSSEDALAARQAIAGSAPPGRLPPVDRPARRGDRVLDCIVVGPGEWWIGEHCVTRRVQSWPGGIWPGTAPEQMVSRAYLKMAEALDWSGLPIKPGQRCVEIGCAPGGASQALLDRGLRVAGVDPAEVDPRILQHRDFRHIRKRGSDVPRREFREFQWLVADMNVAPAYTLACVRDIVTYRLVNIRGVILNLKLLEWKLAAEVPNFLAELRAWGYRRVRARQLSFQRQEVCLTGIRPPARSRRRAAVKKRRWHRRA